ncbi:MAG: AraC family transcriptional regulator [Flavobacteriaceae bacterium]|nr:AraC family transcriptional regulator [Flavobacteriaceae bacterium]
MAQSPSFDTWTSGFLIAVAMGLFLFILLITGRNRRNYPIAFFVLSFCVILFQYVLYWTRYELEFPYLMLLPAACYYTTGPLLYLYFLQLYKKEISFNYGLHFLPAFVLLVPNVGMWLRYLQWTDAGIPLLWLAQKPWFQIIHMSIYALLVILLVQRNKGLKNQYTRLRHTWGLTLSGLYVVFILALASYYILVRFPFFNSQWDYMISITMSISIYAIGYFIFKQPAVFDGEFYTQLFLPDENKKESLEDTLMNELYKNVTNYMEQKKPYIDNELRLVQLADQLGFSAHLLSKVINKKSGMNFNKFVNEYRLLEAERLLQKTSSPSIKSVYFDVGFNSKAAFYNAFKKKHNCTPSEFRMNAGVS